MEINASLDLGNNITSMLEKLAGALGLTVEKIFPYYVKEIFISAVTDIIIGVISFIIFIKLYKWITPIAFFVKDSKRSSWDVNGAEPNGYMILSIMLVVCMFISGCYLLSSISGGCSTNS